MRESRTLRAMWRGLGNGLTVRLVRHSHRKRGETDRPRLRSTAPALDPTGKHRKGQPRMAVCPSIRDLLSCGSQLILRQPDPRGALYQRLATNADAFPAGEPESA